MSNAFATLGAIFLGLVGAYAFAALLLYVYQRDILYRPDVARPDPAIAELFGLQAVTLRTADDLELLAWYRPAEGGKPTLVHVHGNGGNIAGRAIKLKPLLEAGYGLLLVDYRGYGGNPGKPDEPGLYRDGRAALAFLAAREVPRRSTVLYGESLGSGVAIQLAMEEAEKGLPFAGLVLEAPYSSIVELGAAHYPYMPVRLLITDQFRSAEKIGRVAAPLLIVHGDADPTVPMRFGRALFAAAAEPKRAFWAAGAGHNDLFSHGAAEAVIAFIDSLPPAPQSQSRSRAERAPLAANR